MKVKNILLNKSVIAIIGIALLFGIVVFVNIKFREHCINNGGKLMVGTNGYGCIYEGKINE